MTNMFLILYLQFQVAHFVNEFAYFQFCSVLYSCCSDKVTVALINQRCINLPSNKNDKLLEGGGGGGAGRRGGGEVQPMWRKQECVGWTNTWRHPMLRQRQGIFRIFYLLTEMR